MKAADLPRFWSVECLGGAWHLKREPAKGYLWVFGARTFASKAEATATADALNEEIAKENPVQWLTSDQMLRLRGIAKIQIANPKEGEMIRLSKGIYLCKVKGASLLPDGQRYYVHVKDYSPWWETWKKELFDPKAKKQPAMPEVHVSEEAKKGFANYFEQLEALRKEREESEAKPLDK